MKKLLILAVILMSARTAKAQSIGPLYVEAKQKIHAQFFLTNMTVVNMPMSVEAKEVVRGLDGKMQFVQPTDGVKIELQDTSAVLAPKSKRSFDYKISCAHDCVVILMAGMMTGKVKEGVNVKIWLPHSVYLCTDTSKGCRERLRKQTGLDQQIKTATAN